MSGRTGTIPSSSPLAGMSNEAVYVVSVFLAAFTATLLLIGLINCGMRLCGGRGKKKKAPRQHHKSHLYSPYQRQYQYQYQYTSGSGGSSEKYAVVRVDKYAAGADKSD